jgi:hypothetical protein
MSGMTPTLTPAYGRDYTSQEQVVESFLAGKDFVYHDMSSPYDGKYCSVRDFSPGQKFKFRYKKLTKSFYYTLPESK